MKILSNAPKGHCKGICSKYKATKPANGQGRYLSGQVRCQVCDIFLTRDGCHDKKGNPVDEDSYGLYCNCCNFRVTSRPRSKFYNEQLKEIKSENHDNLWDRFKKKITEKILQSNNSKPEPIKNNVTNSKVKLPLKTSVRKERQLEMMKSKKVENAPKGVTRKCTFCDETKNVIIVYGFPLCSLHNKEISGNVETKLSAIKNSELDKKKIKAISKKESKTHVHNLHKIQDSNIKNETSNKKAECHIHDIRYNGIKCPLCVRKVPGKFLIPRKIEVTKSMSPELLEVMNNFSKTVKDFAEKIFNSKFKEIESSIEYRIFYKLFQNPSVVELLYDVYRVSRIHDKIPEFWSDYVDDGGKYGVDRFENIFSTYSEMKKYMHYSLFDEINTIYEYGNKTRDIDQSSSGDSKGPIEKLSKELIEKYQNIERKIDRDLKLELINKYIEVNSVKKICKLYPQYTEDEIRFNLRTQIRLPKSVQTLLHDGSINPNPESALSIALFATDYYQWDGDSSIAYKVDELVKKISKYLQKNPESNQSLMGKKLASDDEKIIIKTNPSKLDKRKSITEKYRFRYSTEWEKGDRTHKQYWRLYHDKDIRVVEFLVRWEFENKRRLPAGMAHKLISEPENFLEEYGFN